MHTETDFLMSMGTGDDIFDTTVVELEKVDYDRPIILGGFVGPTLTGFIAASYIIERMGLHQIGHVRSPHIPPMAVFIGKKLRTPFRIYTNKAGTLLVMICEVPIDDDGLYEISSSIMSWLEDKSPSEILIMEGAPVGEVVKDHEVYCIANEKKIEQFTKVGINPAHSALITGMGGAILNECLARKVSGTSFITPASVGFPDPGAVLALINNVNTVFSLHIDTGILEENVKQFHDQLNELMDQYRKIMKGKEKGPAETMYG